MNGNLRIAKLTAGLALMATLAACGNTSSTGGAGEEDVMIQKGTYVYDPNRRHAPVSLSAHDLQGIEIR